MRQIASHHRLARKLRRFIDLSDEEIQTLAELETQDTVVERQTELVSEGARKQDCYVLLDGWAAAFKLLPDGRRQIINFAVPGDFLGLRSFLLLAADHSVVTLTQAVVSRFREAQMLSIINNMPRLGAAILWSMSREEAIVVEHLVNVGRRTALERAAHLLLELGVRLEQVGLASFPSYVLPVTQEDLGDALGLTSVHINRTFKQLRERGLVSFSQHRVEIHDPDGLRELAQFSADYLDQMRTSAGKPPIQRAR